MTVNQIFCLYITCKSQYFISRAKAWISTLQIIQPQQAEIQSGVAGVDKQEIKSDSIVQRLLLVILMKIALTFMTLTELLMLHSDRNSPCCHIFLCFLIGIANNRNLI